MNERQARRVTLVQAFDACETPLWTREDRQWATRLAAQTAPEQAAPERLLVERASHALQRLLPRDPAVGRWLSQRGWRPAWLMAALAAGFLAGLLADLIGRRQWIDLLAPAAWAVVGWNLAIYAVLALTALKGGAATAGWFRRLLAAGTGARVGAGPAALPLREASRRWAEVSSPLLASRAAVMAHLGAAALAAGLVSGLYLRGLVLDYRAAWESTFLEAPMIHAVLSVLLGPASLVTGVALPGEAELAAMRLTPSAAQASASAAPWIHLYAATLVLAVVLPRLGLAVFAALRATWQAARLRVPVDAAAVAHFARWHRAGQSPVVMVLPYGQTPAAQAALGLRQVLASELGDDLVLKIADVTLVGDEEAAPVRAGEVPVALRVVLVDLSGTPEDEHHGRFLKALSDVRPAAPWLLLVDESAFRMRFASLPNRLEERRGAWRAFAARHGCRLAIVQLDQPEQPEGPAAVQQALAA